MRKLYLTFLAAVMALCASAAEHKMYSPDGKYEMTVTDVNGAVEYSISWGGRQIVLPSRLGIKSGQPYLEGLKLKSKDVLEFNLRESGGVAIRIYAGRR